MTAAAAALPRELLAAQTSQNRPNILWILSEDISPDLNVHDYIIAARDRCDETVDRIRCVRTRQYKYIHNFMPERPYTQPNAYKEQSYPMLNLMKELYDVTKDPGEINNLAASPQHQATLKTMRAILDKWIKETGDMGQFPEKPGAVTEQDRIKIYGK